MHVSGVVKLIAKRFENIENNSSKTLLKAAGGGSPLLTIEK